MQGAGFGGPMARLRVRTFMLCKVDVIPVNNVNSIT